MPRTVVSTQYTVPGIGQMDILTNRYLFASFIGKWDSLKYWPLVKNWKTSWGAPVVKCTGQKVRIGIVAGDFSEVAMSSGL